MSEEGGRDIRRRIIIDLSPQEAITLETSEPSGQTIRYPEMDTDTLVNDPQIAEIASAMIELAQHLYARAIALGARRIAVPLDPEPPDTPPTAHQE